LLAAWSATPTLTAKIPNTRKIRMSIGRFGRRRVQNHFPFGRSGRANRSIIRPLRCDRKGGEGDCRRNQTNQGLHAGILLFRYFPVNNTTD
jgi:hypothetical protein